MLRVVFVMAMVIGIMAAIVAVSYIRDIRAAHARIASGSLLAYTPCGAIEYAVAGGGSPVLVVHGSGGGFDQGMSLGRDLADRGFRVISVSRFGYLRTPLPRDASAEAQADAHACLLDALGVPAVAVVGASAGAPSSLQFALRYPKRTTALALLVPAIYAPRAQGAAPVHTPPGLEFVFELS